MNINTDNNSMKLQKKTPTSSSTLNTTIPPKSQITPMENPPEYNENPLPDLPPYTESPLPPYTDCVKTKNAPPTLPDDTSQPPSKTPEPSLRTGILRLMTQNKKRPPLTKQIVVAQELIVSKDQVNPNGVFLGRSEPVLKAIHKELNKLLAQRINLKFCTPSELEIIKTLTIEINYDQVLTSMHELHGLTNLKELNLIYLGYGKPQDSSKFPSKGLLHATPKLTSLNIEKLSLNQLIPEINHLENLSSLKLKNTLLNDSIDFSKLTQLTTIEITQSNLEELPQEIFQCTYLRHLILRENQIKTAHIDFQQLPLLEKLDLSENELSKFSATTGKISYLKYLNLQKNKLEEINMDFEKYQNLEDIHLKKNNLSCCPNNISYIGNLRTLDLSYNSIPTILADIENTSLEYLNLYSNKLGEIEDNPFRNFPNLKGLNLGSNGIWKLPDNFIENLKKLEYLELEFNNIQKISNQVFPRPSNKLNKLNVHILQTKSIILENHAYLFLFRSPSELGFDYTITQGK